MRIKAVEGAGGLGDPGLVVFGRRADAGDQGDDPSRFGAVEPGVADVEVMDDLAEDRQPRIGVEAGPQGQDFEAVLSV